MQTLGIKQLLATLVVTCLILVAQTPLTRVAHAAAKSNDLAVFSIVPSQAEPGSQVTLTLTNVQDGMTLLLGGSEVSWRALDDRRVSFTIDPQTPPGQHSLSVRATNGTARSYSFTVVPLKPVAVSISPDRITSCSGGSTREVTVTGRNFGPTSQLLFDGAIIRSRVSPPDTVRFTAPATRGGLHQVAVKNNDLTTTPLGLVILTAPEITAVTTGNNYVNSYELVLEGDNFQQTSALLVNGSRIDTGGNLKGERLQVINCTRMVYLRQPYSSTLNELRLQVVNPDGEASQTVIVAAP